MQNIKVSCYKEFLFMEIEYAIQKSPISLISREDFSNDNFYAVGISGRCLLLTNLTFWYSPSHLHFAMYFLHK